MRIAREHPRARIYITGCYAAGDRAELAALPNVAAVCFDKRELAELIARELHVAHPLAPTKERPSGEAASDVAQPPSAGGASSLSSQARAPVLHKHQQQSHPGAGVPHQPHKPHQQARHGRAYLKIQDGCDAFCSYCIVPLVRPTLRSEPIDAILREARAIVNAGFLEIVLTGIHLGRYGAVAGVAHPPPGEAASDVAQPPSAGGASSLSPQAGAPVLHKHQQQSPPRAGVPHKKEPQLHEVVRRVAATPGLARVRLSSLEMPEVSDELIDLIATNAVVCPHLHLPLQSGDAGVLAAMNRRYTPSEFLATVRRIRERVPEIAITTDVIVGFPGESDDAFLNTLRVVGEAAFSKVHVFPFSARPGTKAADLPKRIPQRVVTRRKKGLIALADTLALRYKRRFIGRVVDVIVETAEADLSSGQTFAVGLTPHYLRVRFEGSADLIDRRVSVRIDRATPELMTGRTCPEAFRGIEPTPEG
jgi:threonylcarbamoyladenosine tRNA methylthiotransferase MtaB